VFKLGEYFFSYFTFGQLMLCCDSDKLAWMNANSAQITFFNSSNDFITYNLSNLEQVNESAAHNESPSLIIADVSYLTVLRPVRVEFAPRGQHTIDWGDGESDVIPGCNFLVGYGYTQILTHLYTLGGQKTIVVSTSNPIYSVTQSYIITVHDLVEDLSHIYNATTNRLTLTFKMYNDTLVALSVSDNVGHNYSLGSGFGLLHTVVWSYPANSIPSPLIITVSAYDVVYQTFTLNL
jgi:hypothetical protein